VDTYKWDSTICTPTYLRFVQVDEYPRMTQWTTTTITRYNTFLSPSYWLFVNKFDSSLWTWLDQIDSSAMTMKLPDHPIHLERLIQYKVEKIEENPYLIFHDSLLKPRSHHGFFSWLLATTPNVWPIRSL